MSLTLRLATAEDIPELELLIPASVRKLSQGFYLAEQVEAALVKVFGVDSQLIRDETFYVAEMGGRIVACGGWSRRRTLFGGDQRKVSGEEPLLDPSREAARLRAFYVRPDWARRGIGAAILRRCEEAARAQRFSRAELLATLPGVPLYAAMGYEEIGPLDVDMGESLKLPCLLMSKTFNPPA